MSKRKSRAKSMFVDRSDLVFEDDSDPEVAYKILNNKQMIDDKKQENDANSGVRSSSRAKKQKNIYDPSEYNGPVHKKKKEAMEAALLLAEAKKKQSLPAPTSKTPSKTPIKAAKTALHSTKSSPNITKPTSDVKKKLVLDKTEAPIKPVQVETITTKVDKPSPQPAAVVVKEPPKRTVNRKKAVPRSNENTPAPVEITMIEQTEVVSSSENSEFEKASTVEMEQGKVPDVSKWSSLDVYNYFITQGFDKKDAVKLKEQEIDGEALLILNRDDLKNVNGLKVGTFLKMWNRVLTFQSGSNDFTQGWK